MAHVLTLYKETKEDDTKAAAALAEELGLVVQAKRYATGRSIERDFKPLSDDELLMWRAFCRTIYHNGEPYYSYLPGSNDVGNAIYETALRVANYGHDTIPGPVLEHWAGIKRNYAFDNFQIRTTERTMNLEDPILLGWFQDKAYLLARWGLESPEALPIKEVARRVMEERAKNCWVYGMFTKRNRPDLDPIWQAASRVLTA